jgi:hypothetical protein
MDTHIDVALILWNPDVIQLMSMVLWHRHLSSSGVEPYEREKVQNLIESGKPSVVVFDLDPPYQRSAAVLSGLMARFSGCSFIMTCADPALALKFVPWLSGYQVFQKPYPIDELGNAIDATVGHPAEGVAAASAARISA